MARYSPSRSFSFHWPAVAPQGLPAQGVTTFGSGRQAVFALARHLAPEGGRVLLPAWVPEGIYLPFKLANWTIEYYELDEVASPNWTILEELVQAKSFDLFVLIHYFGQIRDTGKLRRILKGSCPILEDWAHTYPTVSWPTPTPGDWALFSPTKIVGTTDGAWMVGPYTLEQSYAKVNRLGRASFVSWQLLYLFGSSMLRFGVPGHSLWNQISGGSYARAYRLLVDFTESPTDISAIGKWLLTHTDHQKVERKRREQAEYFLSHINSPHVRVLQEGLPLLPWIGLPLRVTDRDQFSSHLAKHGIRGQQFTERWWFSSSAAAYPCARALWQNHYLLPIHQDFTLEDTAAIVAIVNEFNPD